MLNSAVISNKRWCRASRAESEVEDLLLFAPIQCRMKLKVKLSRVAIKVQFVKNCTKRCAPKDWITKAVSAASIEIMPSLIIYLTVSPLRSKD